MHVCMCTNRYRQIHPHAQTYTYTFAVNFLLYLKFKVLFLAVKVLDDLTTAYDSKFILDHSPGTLVFCQFLKHAEHFFSP